MNNYQLNDEIGKGSCSTVYKGRRRNTIDYYAISSIDKGRRPYVLNSVQTLRTLNHTNVIRFHNWYETNNHLWVIAEYCTGGDLKSIMSSGEKLSDASVRAFGRDIASGLAFMHAQGVLNNDVKPSNLLMDATATLRYYDFSLSCAFDNAATRVLVGAPLYMAPELFFLGSAATSTASDIWSFGCLMYEMTTGAPLFTGSSLTEVINSILTKPFKPISGASPALNNLLKITLEKNPLTRATWADVEASPYWEGLLVLPKLFPSEPAFEALKASYSKSNLDVRAAVAQAVQSHRSNISTSTRQSVDGTNATEVGFDKETYFGFSTTSSSSANLSKEATEEFTNNSKLVGRRGTNGSTNGGSSTLRHNSGSNNTTSTNAATNNTESETAIEGAGIPNRRGAGAQADKQYQSATTGSTRKSSTAGADDRFNKAQIEAFNNGLFAKIKIQDVISHTSDAHIRPLCMNNRIEHYEEKSFDAGALPFKALTLAEVKTLGSAELTQYVTTIYKPLSSSGVSHDDKLNIMYYFEGICPDASTANILVNSSVMLLCLKLAAQMEASSAFRASAASIMGILVRHTTFIHADLAKSNMIPSTVNLCKKEKDIIVKRKLLACLGEFLFYVAVRPEKEREPWGIDRDEVRSLFLDALTCSDEIYKHYAAKAIENLGSVADKHLIRYLFASKDILEALIGVYADGVSNPKQDHMRSNALCAAFKLAMIDDSLILPVLKSKKVPPSCYGRLVQGSPVHRTVQIFFSFLNWALLRALANLKNVYLSAWAAHSPESDCLKPSSMSSADADSILTEIGDRSDEVVEGACEAFDNFTPATKGKTLVFCTLIGCLGGTTFSRVASSRHVSFLDRIMREQDKYIEQCSSIFELYVSLFISEKLGFVSQKVSSTTTPFYLSAVQQLLGANTIRSKIVLQNDMFKSLADCIDKSMTNSMFGAYEDSFNNISERLTQAPETVLLYSGNIASFLVRPYADMLSQKESQKRFTAMRFLSSVMTPLSTEPRLSKDTTIIKSVSVVINAVVDNFSTLLAEMNPVPSTAVRLLVCCGEWMPKLLVPKLSDDFLKSIFQYLSTAREIDLSAPLTLTYLTLFNSGKEEFLTYIIQEKVASFIVKTLSNAYAKGIDYVVESCCELAAYILKRVVVDPVSKNAQQCSDFLSNDSMKKLYLPLCNAESKSTAENASSITYDLVRLSAAAQADFLSSVGVETVVGQLTTGQLPLVTENLLKAMRHSIENQKKSDIQKISSIDTLVSALSTYNSSLSNPNKNKNGVLEACKLMKLIKN